MTDLATIQRHVGVPADGKLGPVTLAAIAKALGLVPGMLATEQPAPQAFDRAAFLQRFVNTKAPAITDDDIKAAAARLSVPPAYIEMIRQVESNGVSFDNSGRPVILPEPHWFYRLTNGRFGADKSFSYPKWGMRPYPKSYDDRWQMLADMAKCDEAAALQATSWGLFQVMGFHWKICGYDSPQDFAAAMVADEDNHLEACVAFIDDQDLEGDLRACLPGNPDSCRAFARAYNGPGYEKNGYHTKMASALRRLGA